MIYLSLPGWCSRAWSAWSSTSSGWRRSSCQNLRAIHWKKRL